MHAGQTQKEFFLNESLARLDLLLHAAVVSELAEPPAEPEAGACYLVADGAQAAWAGRIGQIAAWDGTAWIFAAATDGMLLRDLSAGSLLLFDQGVAAIHRASRARWRLHHRCGSARCHWPVDCDTAIFWNIFLNSWNLAPDASLRLRQWGDQSSSEQQVTDGNRDILATVPGQCPLATLFM